MRIWKKVTALLLSSALLLGTFAACGAKTESKTTAAALTENTEAATAHGESSGEETGLRQNPDGTRTILDQAGNEVTIPAELHRVVILSMYALPSVYCLFDGAADKLVGMHPSSKAAAVNSQLVNIYPGLKDVTTDFYQGNDLNVEELLKLQPDVVFYSADNKEEYEKCVNAGIPAIGFSSSKFGNDAVRTFAAWVQQMGEIMGQEEVARGMIEEGEKNYEEIEEKLKSAGDKLQKPKVLILFNYGNGVMKTSGGDFFGQYWIESAGGINVAQELRKQADITMEQVYAWDPDMIFITNFSAYQPSDLFENKIEGDDWSKVKAVQDRKVYKFPLGMYRWFPPAAESPLTLSWMATKIQPELFSDIDMNQRVKEYYKNFYHYDITEEQLEQVFYPPSAAAGQKK